MCSAGRGEAPGRPALSYTQFVCGFTLLSPASAAAAARGGRLSEPQVGRVTFSLRGMQTGRAIAEGLDQPLLLEEDRPPLEGAVVEAETLPAATMERVPSTLQTARLRATCCFALLQMGPQEPKG